MRFEQHHCIGLAGRNFLVNADLDGDTKRAEYHVAATLKLGVSTWAE